MPLTIIEGTKVSSELALTAWSRKEWDSGDGHILIRRSEKVWSLTENGITLLIVGLYKPTLTNIPELWLIMCEGFSKQLRRNIRVIHAYFDEILLKYPRIEVRLDAGFVAGLKFAQFMDFRFVEKAASTGDGRTYLIYEVRKWL